MKKLLICLLALLMLTGCSKEPEKSDSEKFKEEYEALNGQSDEQGGTYSEIEISEENAVIYADGEDIAELFVKGTHVVYLGWPQCGWCRRAVPVLVDVVNEYSGVNLYVYNIRQGRDDFANGVDSAEAKIYQQICEALQLSDFDYDEVFDRYEDGTLKLVSSAVYFVKDGQVIGVHKRTVDSHLDSYEPLTDQQKQELSEIYRFYLNIITTKSEIGCSECD